LNSMSKRLTTTEKANRIRLALSDFRCTGIVCRDCPFYLYPEGLHSMTPYGQQETLCLSIFMYYWTSEHYKMTVQNGA